MIFKAIEFAVNAHKGQYRKGTKIPYIIHPIGVARILIDYGCSEEVITAGILHDTVEDTHISLQDIKREFGEKTEKLVEGASELDKSDTWENRKQSTIDKIKDATEELLMVECADKLDNIRAIRSDCAKYGDIMWQRFRKPKEKQKWYYESLANAFLSRSNNGPGTLLFKEFASGVKRVFS